MKASPWSTEQELISIHSCLPIFSLSFSSPTEHHLQAAISAAAIRAASSRTNVASPSSSSRSSTTNLKPPPPVAENLYHIPTPDATGVVADYESLYVPHRWFDPSSYVRFSDTVEETSGGPAGLGYTYTLDERDDEWLKNNNRLARGEGTSASGASANGGNASPSDAGRGARGKGKDREREKEETVVPVLTEDEFELVMALMERWTDEKFPTLHTVRSISFFRCSLVPSRCSTSFPPVYSKLIVLSL